MIVRRFRSFIPLAPAVLILACTAGLPAVYAVGATLFSSSGNGIAFSGFGNLLRVINDRGLGLSLRITVVWALLVTIISMSAGFLLGFALQQGRLRYALYPALLLPWGVPAFILIPLWRMLLHGEGGTSTITLLTGISINLLNDPTSGFASTACISAWMTMPIIAFAIYASLNGMPSVYRDTARMDGAGEGYFAFRIYSPMYRNLLITLAVLTFFRGIKEFSAIHILTDGGPPFLAGISTDSIIGVTTTIEIYLYRLFSHTFDFGVLSGYSLVPFTLVVPVILIWMRARVSTTHEAVLRPDSRRPASRRPGFWRPEFSRTVFFLILSAVQPILGGNRGIPSAILYLAMTFLPGLAIPLFCADVVLNAINIIIHGFPGGLNPGFIIACCAMPTIIPVRQRAERDDNRHAVRSMLSRIIPRTGRLRSIPTSSAFRGIRMISAGIAIGIATVLCYFLVWLSFSGTDLVFVDRLIPRYATLDNFREIFSQAPYFRGVFNSLKISLLSALLTVLVAFPAASTISRQPLSRSGRSLGLIQASVAIGGMHTLVPLFWMARQLGLVGSHVPLVVLYTAHSLPISILLLTTFLRSLPESFRDVALIEGCSERFYVTRILVPISRPTLTLAAILTFVGAWNGFLAPLIFLFDADRYPISLVLYHLVGTIGSASPRWGIFAAGSAMNFVILSGALVYLRGRLAKSDLSGYSPDS